MNESTPAESPFRLWTQAAQEHPGDTTGRRRRYRDLLVEAGHVKGEVLVIAADAFEAPPGVDPDEWLARRVAKITNVGSES